MSLSVALFALVGSVALLAMIQSRGAREERRAFEELARANAAFLDRTGLPLTARMARDLAEVLGVEVWFVSDAAQARPVGCAPDGRARRDGRRLIVGRTLAGGRAAVFFARPRPAAANALRRAESWFALGGFWLLALALGAWLARRVARPLVELANAVPAVGGEAPLPPLPVNRPDEIGTLARTLNATHRSLHDERARRHAAERLALLGRMAASLAHEVRNPVAAIRLHAQLLDGAAPAEAATSRTLIATEAARIEALVNQWLHLARPAPTVMAALDLAELLAHAAGLLGPQAKHAGVTIDLPPTPPVAPLPGDRERLHQALSNILLNAIQAMPRGGSVRIATELPAPDRLRVVITDHGPGFTPAALAHAGEPFFSQKEGGMGLGLAVAREIARAHGGDLHCTNHPAAGAQVILELPTAGEARPNG